MAVERRGVGVFGGYGNPDGVLDALPSGLWREAANAESLPATTTTSTVLQNKVTMSPVLEPGDYRLHWSYNWNHNANTNDIVVELTVDGSNVNPATGFEWMREQTESKDSGGGDYPPGSGSGTNQSYPRSGWVDFTVLATSSNAHSIQFASSAAGIISTIWNARLRLERRFT